MTVTPRPGTTGRVSSPERRDGRNAYDDLVPELERLAATAPDDPQRVPLRDRLVEEFLPLVRNMAGRYSTAGHPRDDIEQVGVIGLIRALDRYDPGAATGGPLAYVVPCVRGEILRYIRDYTWAMRVPRHYKELSVAVNRASGALVQRLGRAARPSEIAQEVGVPVEQVVDTLVAMDSQRATSLDAPGPDDGPALGERIPEQDDALDIVEDRGDLRRLIGELPERERTVLLLRFYGEKTQSQIGEEVGVSQMHVSRLLSRTLAHLREQLLDEDGADPDLTGGPALR